MELDSRELIGLLERDGWYKVAQRGSHLQFKHPVCGGRITIPQSVEGIPIGTMEDTYKQAESNNGRRK